MKKCVRVEGRVVIRSVREVINACQLQLMDQIAMMQNEHGFSEEPRVVERGGCEKQGARYFHIATAKLSLAVKADKDEEDSSLP